MLRMEYGPSVRFPSHACKTPKYPDYSPAYRWESQTISHAIDTAIPREVREISLTPVIL